MSGEGSRSLRPLRFLYGRRNEEPIGFEIRYNPSRNEIKSEMKIEKNRISFLGDILLLLELWRKIRFAS